MAIVDGDRGDIVIRLVYDGPPLSGKTTSLKALAEILAARRRSDVFTPAEAEGRTLYFDWMDYLGGWFDGHQVRCQIISVPGQPALADRRRMLLREADAVVFVAESTSAGVDLAREHYRDMKASLLCSGEPAVPIVMQANKQDLPDAVSVDELHQHFLDERHMAIVHSCASEGVGVREAFTFAVRLALDRVRELIKQGKLPEGEPEIQSGEELLHWIEREEARGSTAADAADGLMEEPRTERSSGSAAPQELVAQPEADGAPTGPVRSGEEPPPALPDSKAPSGLVWPPMAGRIILHELESGSPKLRRLSDGSWAAIVGKRWRLLSEAQQLYSDMEAGRRALLEAARFHTALGPLLSENRAIALTEARIGCWRVWRLVRTEHSLRDAAVAALGEVSGDVAAQELFRIADSLIRTAARFGDAELPLRAALRTLGECEGKVRYIGIVPSSANRKGPVDPGRPEELIRREFGPVLESIVQDGRIDVPGALRGLREILRARPERLAVVEVLAAMLIGH